MTDLIPIAKPIIGDSEKQEVMRVLDSGMLAAGEWVRRFENEFSDFAGARYGVATSSGTTALYVALEALGIGNGDVVATTPFSFIASSNSVLFAGGRPFFCDIDPDTYNLDPDALARALESHPEIRAVLVVHLFGLPAAMDEIMELIREYDLLLIEDCAQAHGARYRGQPVGTFGDAAAFSFYPTKNMTTGEGGMVLTDDEKTWERAQALIDHCSEERYHHRELGYNFRMTNIAAALGCKQLEKLAAFNRRRWSNAERLTEGLRGLPGLQLPQVPEGVEHVFHQYTIRCRERDRLACHLEAEGIGHGVYYPLPINRQPLYANLGCTEGPCPQAERASREVISLPVHPGLEDGDLERIIGSVRAVCAG